MPPTTPASSVGDGGQLSTGRATTASVVSTVISAFPVFVLGSLAPLLAVDIGVPEAAIGSVVGVFFLTSALTSLRGGRLSERYGWARVVLVGGVVTAAVAIVGAVVVQRTAGLVVLSALLGVANGLVQPAATEALSAAVPAGHQGPAFGAKHAAVPAASLLAGLSIPTVAVGAGWRWTFASVGLLLVPLVAVVPWSRGAAPTRSRDRAGPTVVHRPLVVTAIGAGLVTAAANALAAYLVVGGVSSGLSLTRAGLLLSACSIACIGTRLASGFLPTDRWGYLPIVLTLCGTGTFGFVLLALSRGAPVAFAIGAILAFAGGWGWSAVLGLGVVRDHPAASASATGVLHAGTFAGGVAGPVLFGVVVGATSYAAAWAVTASLSAAGLACFATVRRTARPAPSTTSDREP